MSNRRAYARPRILGTNRLLAHHLTDLAKSRIGVVEAGLAGICSASHEVAYDFGIRGEGELGGLLFPYWDVAEQRFSKRFVRLKPDLTINGRKYLQPIGERPRLFFVAGTLSVDLVDVQKAVFLAEGEKKVLALHRAVAELAIPALVVGMGGVWGWRCSPKELQPDGRLGKGKSRAIPDFDLIRWVGRKVYVFMDGDVALNWRVAAAETSLARELAGRGGEVFVTRLPGGTHGQARNR